jgi:arabinan endo-1,5-alpha-L-arabinosidase
MRRLATVAAVVSSALLLVGCDPAPPERVATASDVPGATTAPSPTAEPSRSASPAEPEPSVTPSPRKIPAAEAYTNPVFDHEAPDPAVMRDVDGTYYVYTTQSEYRGEHVNVPVLRSRDLVHWSFVGDAMPTFPSWGGIDTWAPHVFRTEGGTYVMYVSVRSNALGIMQVVTELSERPEGPFEPNGRPLLGPAEETIDPFVLRASDGSLWFYWSVDNSIRVRALSEDGLDLSGPTVTVLEPIGEEGTGYDSVVEGAWVTEHAGRFYLFSSGDICCGADAHYAVAVSRSDSPQGPFERNPANPVLRASDAFVAPGHNSVATDDAGHDWIVFHAMTAGTPTYDRVMLIDRIRWVEGWPVIDDDGVPSSDPRRRPVVDIT